MLDNYRHYSKSRVMERGSPQTGPSDVDIEIWMRQQLRDMRDKLEATESLLKCRTNDLDQLQCGYDKCHADLTLHRDLVCRKDKELEVASSTNYYCELQEAEATIKAIATDMRSYSKGTYSKDYFIRLVHEHIADEMHRSNDDG